MRILMLAILLFILLPRASASARDLQSDMATLLQSQKLQGAVWATLDSDGTVSVGASGVKNAGSGEKMRPEDRVHTGSVAKTLLATGVLRLVSQGRLSLDAPVSTLLPEVTFGNSWASHPVRLRHLLDHTSGLDDARFSQVFSLRPSADTPLANAFGGDRSLLHIRSRPGARFSYSNMGYTLAGRVIEEVTMERYERYLNANLLGPLGMHDSSFSFVAQAGPLSDPRLAMGHVENGVSQAAVPTFLRPAGQFTSTAGDMAKLARFLMGDGRIGGAQFIDARLLQAMGLPNGTEAANAGLRVGFGLGLGTRDRHGAIGKCHGGSTVGYRAMFCLFPQQRKAYFVAVNTDSETANYGALDNLMLEALSVGPQEIEPAPEVAFDPADWVGYYVPAPNRFATFAWVDTVFNFVRLRKVGGGLSFAPFQSPAVELTQVRGALFRAHGRLSASHVLLTSDTGERVISTGSQSYEKVSLVRLASLWASLLLGLLGMACIVGRWIVPGSTRRMSLTDPLLAPFIGIVALLLPIPLLYSQSFLELGDFTLAGGLLAAVTGLLPLAMLAGLGVSMGRSHKRVLDIAAMLAVLQLTTVLAFWGLLPLRLWA